MVSSPKDPELHRQAKHGIRLLITGCAGIAAGTLAGMFSCLLRSGVLATVLRLLVDVWLCAMGAVLLWGVWVGIKVINAVDQLYGNTGEASGDATESRLGTARDKLG